jgi:hypothetical protein
MRATISIFSGLDPGIFKTNFTDLITKKFPNVTIEEVTAVKGMTT